MNHRDALASFRELTLGMDPRVKADIRMAWVDYIDSLHRDRAITDAQAHAWVLPTDFTIPAPPEIESVWRSRANGSRACVDDIQKGEVQYTYEGKSKTMDVRTFMGLFSRATHG